MNLVGGCDRVLASSTEEAAPACHEYKITASFYQSGVFIITVWTCPGLHPWISAPDVVSGL